MRPPPASQSLSSTVRHVAHGLEGVSLRAPLAPTYEDVDAYWVPWDVSTYQWREDASEPPL